jgi:hypothetical protein
MIAAARLASFQWLFFLAGIFLGLDQSALTLR